MHSKALLCASFLLSGVAAHSAVSDWEKFKVKFGKSYESKEEEKLRFEIFQDNLKLIEERNAKDTAQHGITKFADLSPSEFEKRFTNYRPNTEKSKEPTEFHKFNRNIPTPKISEDDGLIDWTNKYTTPVKNQGYCGSCWAFSAVEQIESDYIRTQNGPLSTELSTQQMNSCTVYDDDSLGDDDGGGCDGGLTENAFDYAQDGLELDFYYPYTSGEAGVTGDCNADPTKFVVKTTSYTTVSDDASGEKAMANYVQGTGPLSICVDASEWSSYTGGVMSVCGDDVDHCVQVVGINMDEGYWKVRNSWGPDWAEDGFIRLSYGNNTCQLASDANYVDVEPY
jgi:C1A family cysteine protease